MINLDEYRAPLDTDEGMAAMMDLFAGPGAWQHDPVRDVWLTPDRTYSGPGLCFFCFRRGGEWSKEMQAPPPPAAVLYDQFGRAYRLAEDVPDHRHALVTALDCLILRDGYLAHARWALGVGLHEHWAACQRRAAGFLTLGAQIDPEVMKQVGPSEGEASV